MEDGRKQHDDEKRLYNKTLIDTGGFDCAFIAPALHLPGLLWPIRFEMVSEHRRNFLSGLARTALTVTEYNNKDTSYQFVNLIRVNSRVVPKFGASDCMLYYITFRVEDDHSSSQNFQALVSCSIDGQVVKFCGLEQESQPPQVPEDIPPFVLLDL